MLPLIGRLGAFVLPKVMPALRSVGGSLLRGIGSIGRTIAGGAK